MRIKKVKNEEFENIFNFIPGIYFILDINFNILTINNECEGNIVNSKKEIIGLSFFKIFYNKSNKIEAKSLEILKKYLYNVIKEKCSNYISVQKYNILKNISNNSTYEERYLRFLNTPVLSDNGKVDFIIVKVDDVTDSMKLKLLNIKSNEDFLGLRFQTSIKEKIQHAQRLESIGMLTGGIAHDINNMLTIVNLNCDIILNSSQTISNVVRKQCEQIKKTCKHTGKLLQQILLFSKKKKTENKVININYLIQDIEKMLIRLLSENITLELDLDNSVKDIFADSIQIEQIILNLVINSRDAILNSGKIIIKTQNINFKEDCIFGSHKILAGNYVLLSIIDDGIGMEPETQSRIFEPFFSTKEEGKGTGLGLATVFKIVENYKGTIDVISELNKGTVFNIYLPSTDLKYNLILDDFEKEENFRGNESVLIVEDKEELKESMATTLKHYGYNVIAVSSSIEALNIIQTVDNKIHIIITDIVLPKINGKLMVDKILEVFPKLKVIFLSGHSDEILDLNGIENNNKCLLRKPFTMIDLLSRIRKSLS